MIISKFKNMSKIEIENYSFYKVEYGRINFIFSTSNSGLDINCNSNEGMNNIKNLKKWFEVENVGYLKQIHSDLIYNYDGEIHQGDAIITDKYNTAVGIFTADCVPVLLADTEKNIAAAVHSGWRGSLNMIVFKTIKKLKQEYGCKSENIVAVIGPHIMDCCYNVGEEVFASFSNASEFKNININNNGKLDLKEIIKHQLTISGVKNENMKFLNMCTYCNENKEFHSYRKDKTSKRNFSFVYIK
ncbi:MAG: laccase [Clostridiaceae bacterium]|jgi:YfiH family protein|nr:laccase [Clostridiaceae bacterium]